MIIGIELSYKDMFDIIPSANGTLGKTIYINIKWLNFELTIKHISRDYKSPRINFYSPSITINQYNNSGYQFTFEIFIFGYTYRKGLFRLKDREVMPTDNTYGFVDESWFEQFRRNDAENISTKILAELQNMIETLKDKINDNEDTNN